MMKTHPIADEYPLMNDDEYRALVRDIKANGLKYPIITYGDQILDGRHRYRACVELGIDPPIITFDGDDDAARHEAESLNIHRRHLTYEQKQKIVSCELKRDITQSDRAIARKAQVHNSTVGKMRAEAEGRGEISHVDKRIDSKGRSQPAKKQRKAPPASMAQSNEESNAKQTGRLPAAIRVEQIRKLLEGGANIKQVVAELKISEQQVRLLIRHHKIPASNAQIGRSGSGRHTKSQQMKIEATIDALSGLAHGIRIIRGEKVSVPTDVAKQLHDEASKSMQEIRWLVAQLKEMANV